MSENLDLEVTVLERLNKRFDTLVRYNSGQYSPHVCIICDKLLKANDVKIISLESIRRNEPLLQQNAWDQISDSLSDCYTINLQQIQHERSNNDRLLPY